MKKLIALAIAAFVIAAPFDSFAGGRMVYIKKVAKAVPEFLSEAELRENGGVWVSNAVYSYQGVIYVEYDFDKQLYRANCCDDEHRT